MAKVESEVERLQRELRDAGRKVIEMNKRLGYTETAQERIQVLEANGRALKAEVSRLQSQHDDDARRAKLDAGRIELLEMRVEELSPLDPVDEEDADVEPDDERTAREIMSDIAAVALRSLERRLRGRC